MRRLQRMIEAWRAAGSKPVQRADPDPDLVETRRQITVLERRVDRLVDGYRKAGEAYARRRP